MRPDETGGARSTRRKRPRRVINTQQAAASPTAITDSHMFGAAQRLIESATIAVVASTALYLVGSVYSEAYYGRMSIEVNSLDLAPSYIALQSMHAIQSLLEYPGMILVFFLLYRLLAPRLGWLHPWYERVREQFGRLFLLFANLLIVSPLIIGAIRAGLREGFFQTSSALSEVAGLMETVGTALLIYVFWLSLGPRQLILDPIRARKFIPIALLFTLYLLDALVATAHGAIQDAELEMTGLAANSIAVEFTWAAGVTSPAGDADLIFVGARNYNYYVVERQPIPPSLRPNAYAIPYDSVIAARTHLINDADNEFQDWFIEEATSESP
ncbi:MAG: hypothetical protein U0031_16945 [Thermomicrobiales bacterium]